MEWWVGSPMKVSGYCALDFRLHLFGGQGQYCSENFSDVLVIAIISPKAKIVQIKTSPSWISTTRWWFHNNKSSKTFPLLQTDWKIHEKIRGTQSKNFCVHSSKILPLKSNQNVTWNVSTNKGSSVQVNHTMMTWSRNYRLVPKIVRFVIKYLMKILIRKHLSLLSCRRSKSIYEFSMSFRAGRSNVP